MSIRLKKLLITMLVAVMFTTTAYATTSFNIGGVVEGATYNDCHFSTQTEVKTKFGQGSIVLGSGAIYHYCTIYALIIDTTDYTARTNFGVFPVNTTVSDLTYLRTNLNKYYQVGAAIERGSYVKNTSVSGAFTP